MLGCLDTSVVAAKPQDPVCTLKHNEAFVTSARAAHCGRHGVDRNWTGGRSPPQLNGRLRLQILGVNDEAVEVLAASAAWSSTTRHRRPPHKRDATATTTAVSPTRWEPSQSDIFDFEQSSGRIMEPADQETHLYRSQLRRPHGPQPRPDSSLAHLRRSHAACPRDAELQ